MKPLKPSILLLSVTITLAQNAAAADTPDPAPGEKDEKGILSITAENDIVFDKDNNYTSGVRIAYISPETVPSWLEKTADFLPLLDTNGNKRWGFAAGQSIYTPNNIQLANPPVSQRPYAGWLYGTVKLISDNITTLDTFQLTGGIVGPSALGEQTQNTVHNIIGDQTAKGWQYQLKDEPGVILSYDRKWRNVYQASPFGLGFDITPSAGANLGNVNTDGNIGLMARFGEDLPSDYGPPLIQPSISGSDFFIPQKNFSWYIFSGLEGKAVAHNIFLDGNSFESSRSVDKEVLVGGIQGGIVLTFDDMRLSLTEVHRTNDYKGETQPEEYGSLTLSVRL